MSSAVLGVADLSLREVVHSEVVHTKNVGRLTGRGRETVERERGERVVGGHAPEVF